MLMQYATKKSLLISLMAMGITVWPVYAAKKITPPPKPTVVEVAKVTQTTLHTKLTSWGSLVAKQQAKLASQVDGQVAAKNYSDGYKGVQEGAVVLTLDSAAEQAAVEADKADLNLKQVTYDANLQLFAESAVSKSAKLKAQSNLLISKSILAKDQVALAQKSIKAPFTGNLGEFKVQKGDYVTAGQPLVTIVNNKKLEVEYSLPEVFFSKIKLNQVARIKSSAYPHKTFVGKVDFISPAVDQSTRSLTLKAALDNSNELLSPGMFVSVEQIIHTEKNAIMVPAEAILYDKNKASVFRLVGNKAYSVPVVLGKEQTPTRVHVIKGLKLNDVVVVKGQEKLKNGASVWVKPLSKKPKTTNNATSGISFFIKKQAATSYS